MKEKVWKVYLSGEIHTNWREEIYLQCEKNKLAINFFSPQLNHEKSDDCGVNILGAEENKFWKDHKAAKINSIRSKSLIEESDILIAKFGDKYRQWNAAFDVGYAAALGKSIITLHEDNLVHPLKEVNAVALASTNSVAQIVEILSYVTSD